MGPPGQDPYQKPPNRGPGQDPRQPPTLLGHIQPPDPRQQTQPQQQPVFVPVSSELQIAYTRQMAKDIHTIRTLALWAFFLSLVFAVVMIAIGTDISSTLSNIHL
jgi:hypothetical protein